MITNFSEYKSLNEFKLSSDNYDKYYYLVLRLNEQTLSNLTTGKLVGLKSISNSIDIINAFFDIRDLLLVMEKEKVDEINNIEPVRYNDIEYLTKDNMAVLKRLYQVTDDYPIESLLYQGIQKIYPKRFSEQVKKINRIINSSTHYKKQYIYFEDNIYSLKKLKPSTTYSELLNNIHEVFTNITLDELDTFVKYICLSFAQVFEKEGEVLIKDSTFVIPEKSVLFIKEKRIDSYSYEDKKALIDKYLSELKKHYNIKMLPYSLSNDSRYSMMDGTHRQAFGMIRYLDKMFK